MTITSVKPIQKQREKVTFIHVSCHCQSLHESIRHEISGIYTLIGAQQRNNFNIYHLMRTQNHYWNCLNYLIQSHYFVAFLHEAEVMQEHSYPLLNNPTSFSNECMNFDILQNQTSENRPKQRKFLVG